MEFTTDYGDACVKLGEEMAEMIYYPPEKGPPNPEMPFHMPVKCLKCAYLCMKSA